MKKNLGFVEIFVVCGIYLLKVKKRIFYQRKVVFCHANYFYEQIKMIKSVNIVTIPMP